MHCIKCKLKKAGATPSLCLRCFTQVAWEWFRFNKPSVILAYCWEGMDSAYFKTYRNNLQKKIQKAHKRHDSL